MSLDLNRYIVLRTSKIEWLLKKYYHLGWQESFKKLMHRYQEEVPQKKYIVVSEKSVHYEAVKKLIEKEVANTEKEIANNDAALEQQKKEKS